MRKYFFIFLGLMILGCNIPTTYNFSNNDQIVDLEQLKLQSAQCFDKAEKEVLNPKPNIVPNDGTNPDPAKCICKGTGIIVQGDGHKTECPYHYKTGSTRNQNVK